MWRNPAEVLSQTLAPHQSIDPRLTQFSVAGHWWETVADLDVTLLITREYEHFVLALGATAGVPQLSYFAIPHPSGLVVDRTLGRVYLASTRNPNQLVDLVPVSSLLPRADVPQPDTTPLDRRLLPVQYRTLPGSLYLHDLAEIDGVLYANAVGENAVVSINSDGLYRREWWPQSIDSLPHPRFDRNYLQLNSIAAGIDLEHSFFSASAERPSKRLPGHRNFAVDGRGVLFSGKTREPVVRGLTRPHSARVHQAKVWLDNSGYGELGFVDSEGFQVASRLPGWTRGLCFIHSIAFVGTSRILPRFTHYAPGLDPNTSICAVHAIDSLSGKTLGSIHFPFGNQIFAIDWAPASQIAGLPFAISKSGSRRSERLLFYAFDRAASKE
jgi:uncharacterized protein (TIGR03032 family)